MSPTAIDVNWWSPLTSIGTEEQSKSSKPVKLHVSALGPPSCPFRLLPQHHASFEVVIPQVAVKMMLLL